MKTRGMLARERAQDELVRSQHRVTTLDPAIWRHLPVDLRDSIFARMPVPAICRMRTLSHECQSLCFGRECMQVNTKMFALIEDHFMNHHGEFLVQLYDVHTNKYHVYPIRVGVVGDESIRNDPFSSPMMSTSDGGLVVFVSASEMTKNIRPLQIEIVNPLTHSRRVLPIKGVTTRQLQMVQIITDRRTGHYKVIVVGDLTKDNEVAYVYFSNRDEWVNMKEPGRILPERFFGSKQDWNLESNYVPRRFQPHPCVYNYDIQKLTELCDNSLLNRGMPLDICALVGDRLFVLHKSRVSWERAIQDSSSTDDDSDQEPQVRDRYCITECQGHIENPNWTKLRSISNVPIFENPSRKHYWMRIFACRGFLLVVAARLKVYYRDSENLEVAWLYDLACEQWRQLPARTEGHWLSIFDHLMVDLRWDTDPNIEADPNAQPVYPAGLMDTWWIRKGKDLFLKRPALIWRGGNPAQPP